MELIVNRGVNAGYVGRMLVYLIPDIVMFALPAVRSCGISLYQMLPPVVILSFFALLISLSIGIIAVPWGNRSFKDVIFQIAESKADLGIKERIFCEPFNGVVFYVNSYSTRDRVMKDVFVVDRRDAKITNTIIAEEGRILSYPQQRIITLHFLRGAISTVEKNLNSARSIKFNTYKMNIGLKDIMSALASRKKAPKELSVGELIKQMNIEPKGELKYNEMMIELLEKFSIPIAVFLMGIIGVPLGVQIRARGRSAGIWISLVVFLIYYMCLAGMKSICETGNISPTVGIWIPDIFLFISCIYLLRRVANERSINFLSAFSLKARRQ
ncbi:MAG: LptF/LptG family permease [Deltaproteobacteria bacterium]|nr:LptF/LptG family permease [Deltaproteobacteria bacterium]